MRYKTIVKPPTASNLKLAAAWLVKAELVVFPTETVYGLGAIATSKAALQKIYAVKQRSHDKPISLLINKLADVYNWAQHISSDALRMANHYWPGPLTLVLESSTQKLPNCTSSKVGLRIPNHPIALSLIRETSTALATSSANISGTLSATTIDSVKTQFDGLIPMILEASSCAIGLESTVIDMTDCPSILREGAISRQSIENTLGYSVKVNPSARLQNIPPKTIVWFDSPRDLVATKQDLKTAAIIRTFTIERLPSGMMYVRVPKTLKSYQRDIYATLHELKAEGYQRIMLEALPEDPSWNAIRTRLNSIHF